MVGRQGLDSAAKRGWASPFHQWISGNGRWLRCCNGASATPSPERLLSGPGLVNLYQALAEVEGWSAAVLEPAEITDRALAGTCPHCRDVLEIFCGALGTAAGEIGVLGAQGGVYIGGGIVAPA